MAQAITLGTKKERMSMIPKATKKLIKIDLKEGALKYREIAAKHGVAPSSVGYIAKKTRVPRTHQSSTGSLIERIASVVEARVLERLGL